MPNKDFIFEVTGNIHSEFPIDMLRYDACWPATEIDAGIIQETFHNRAERADKPQVRLRSNQEPTPARWESFTWKIFRFID